MRKQAAYWSLRIPKVLAENDARKRGHGTEEKTIDTDGATDTDAATVTATSRKKLQPFTPSAPVDAAQFVLGRAFPAAKRNNTYDRFPLSYAPTCAGLGPCTDQKCCGSKVHS